MPRFHLERKSFAKEEAGPKIESPPGLTLKVSASRCKQPLKAVLFVKRLSPFSR